MFSQASKRGMFRRTMAASLAGVMVLGGTVSVSAATVKDVFDAKFYTESYGDLQKTFGTNTNALYNHYKTFGKKEGRQMSELIDVVKYKNAYPDLAAVFGDDWDAYVNHYVTYGFNEGRNSFGSFDARAYADRYPDLKKAFGYDVLKLYKHYMQFGRNEGRNAASGATSVVDAEYWENVAYWENVERWAGNETAQPDAGASDEAVPTPPETGSTGNLENAGQITTAGRLVDPETGAAIANATIRFTNTSFTGLTEVVELTAEEETPDTEVTEPNTEATTAGVYEATTDENGYYEVPSFTEGVYTVEVSAPGYMNLTMNSITIASDSDNFTLPTFQLLSSNMSGANTVAGTVVDATTAAGISNVTLNVRTNWNNTSGDVFASTVTDADGNYSLNLERGYYTIEFVVNGYTANFVNVASSNAVGATNCVLNPNSTTTEEVSSTDFRIVLTWGETPRDLDSHLVGPAGDEDGCFHVYFGDKIAYDANGAVSVSLDVDDTSSYGPETITIADADVNNTYFYSVYDWTNGGLDSSAEMSASGANVKVYQGSVLVKEYNVPLNQTGYVWNVFKIENGRVVDINNYNSQYDSMYGAYADSMNMGRSAVALSGDKN